MAAYDIDLAELSHPDDRAMWDRHMQAKAWTRHTNWDDVLAAVALEAAEGAV